MEYLTVTSSLGEDQHATVTVSGEIDAGSCGTLDNELFEAMASGCTVLDLDMADVTFMDSSGIRSLVRFGGELAGIGGRLRIVSLSKAVRQTLELTGLLQVYAPGAVG